LTEVESEKEENKLSILFFWSLHYELIRQMLRYETRQSRLKNSKQQAVTTG